MGGADEVSKFQVEIPILNLGDDAFHRTRYREGVWINES
jgi:hypothetical protein